MKCQSEFYERQLSPELADPALFQEGSHLEILHVNFSNPSDKQCVACFQGCEDSYPLPQHSPVVSVRRGQELSRRELRET